MHYIAERFWIGKVSWFRLYITYVVDYDSIIQRAKLNLKTKLEWLRVVILKFENWKKCQLFDNSKWLIKEVIKFLNALCDKYVLFDFALLRVCCKVSTVTVYTWLNPFWKQTVYRLLCSVYC